MTTYTVGISIDYSGPWWPWYQSDILKSTVVEVSVTPGSFKRTPSTAPTCEAVCRRMTPKSLTIISTIAKANPPSVHIVLESDQNPADWFEGI